MNELYPKNPEIQYILSPKCPIFEKVELTKKTDFLYDEITKEKEAEITENKSKFLSEESYLINKMKILFEEKFRSEDFLKLTKIEQIDYICDFIKSGEDTFKILPDTLINLMAAHLFDGDSGNSPDVKPDWLDLEKFKKGQKFAMDNFFGQSYAQFLSLFNLFSFEDSLKPLIITGKSSTPYTAFKRYVSTGIRVRSWYTDDPWTKGTGAYKNILAVRKMHENLTKKLLECEFEEIDAASTIKNPLCPTRDILVKDFQSSCSAPALGQRPHKFSRRPELKDVFPKGIRQSDMAGTQFGFVGLLILYPKHFGVHNATREDFEAFCHTWRGIGYLLGIDDEFNLCRGSLEEIKARCKDFLELWAIPNLRELQPECEHMLRCVAESVNYYFPGSSYESAILFLSDMLNLQTPTLYKSVTYRNWLTYNFLKYYFLYSCQVPGVKSFLNKKISLSYDEAVKFSAEKHEELKKKSEETLKWADNKTES